MKLSLLKLVTLIGLIIVGMSNVFAQQYEILGLMPKYDYLEYIEENSLKLSDKGDAIISEMGRVIKRRKATVTAKTGPLERISFRPNLE